MPDLSYEQKRALIMAALDPSKRYMVWIRDLFDDRVVIEEDNRLFEMPYTIADDGKVTLGVRKEVITSYVQLAEMKDVEVLKVGTFTSMNGAVVTYTEKDLEEIEANAKTLDAILRPPLVATHDEGEDASVTVFGSVHGGLLHNVRKSGEKLLADIKGVPKKAAELLEEVGEFRLSPEIYSDFQHEGESYGKALRRVAWVAIPAIKTMAGITAANLYEEKPDQPTTWVRFNEPGQVEKRKEKKDMPDLAKLQEDMTKLSEKVTTLESENKSLKAEKEQAMTKLSEKETGERKAKALGIVKPMRDAGLAPAIAERMEKFAEGLDNSRVEKFGEKDHTLLDEFGSILDSIVKRDAKGRLFVPFGEQAPGASKGEGKSKDEEREEAIKKYEETNKVDYRTAVLAVSKEKPELFKND